MRCMVILLVRLSTSRNWNFLNQSPLYVTSVLAMSMTLLTCLR